MELDDLKQAWHEPSNFSQPNNNNIMELTLKKSQAPLAALTMKFRRQLLGVPVLAGIAIYHFRTKPELFDNPAVWVLYGLCLLLAAYFCYNYYIVKHLQDPAKSIKENFELQVKKLDTSFKWYQAAGMIYCVSIPIAIEAWMIFGTTSGFTPWSNVHLLIRMLLYITGAAAIYLCSRKWFQKQYGDHMKNLRDLVAQLQ